LVPRKLIIDSNPEFYLLLNDSPAPALFVAASGYPKVLLYWWPFNFLGVFIAEYAKKIF
jgi:hypothetical protein